MQKLRIEITDTGDWEIFLNDTRIGSYRYNENTTGRHGVQNLIDSVNIQIKSSAPPSIDIVFMNFMSGLHEHFHKEWAKSIRKDIKALRAFSDNSWDAFVQVNTGIRFMLNTDRLFEGAC